MPLAEPDLLPYPKCIINVEERFTLAGITLKDFQYQMKRWVVSSNVHYHSGLQQGRTQRGGWPPGGWEVPQLIEGSESCQQEVKKLWLKKVKKLKLVNIKGVPLWLAPPPPD